MKKWHLTISVALLGIIIGYGYLDSLSYRGNLRVSLLDIGQGDAILLTDPVGYQVLIDGGPDAGGVISELESSMPILDRSIDMVILTHPDADHVGGLPAVLERYRVSIIVDNLIHKDTEIAQKFRRLSIEEGAIRRSASAGTNIVTPGGVRLKILHPFEDYASDEVNNYSIVVKVEYGDNSLLLTGDIDSSVEMGLLDRYDPGDLQSDILKIPHHGSRYSSSLAFLRAVNPRIAIVSYGCQNSYNHPNPVAVRRYEYYDIPVYTTCDRGTITLTGDTKDFWLESVSPGLF